MGKKIYIGLATSGHDSSIAFLSDTGTLLFAEASERYLQNKRALNSLPDDFGRVRHLLEKYCGDCETVVINYSWSRSFAVRMLALAPWVAAYERWRLKRKPGSTFMEATIYGYLGVACMAGRNLKYRLCALNPKIKIIERYYDHHLTHAAFACWSSPYQDAACAIVDGFGEWSSTLFCDFKNHRISPLRGLRKSLIPFWARNGK
jgi:carbamoyltransferase